MKMIFLGFFAVLVCSASFAQAPEKSIAKVQYTFTHIRDTTAPDKPYQENMVLIIGKNASRYLSLDALANMTKILQDLKRQAVESQGGKLTLSIGPGKDLTREEYFYFTKENKLIIQQHLINTYLVEEPTYHIDWRISNDTMSFEGIHCRKASAHFKGRNWIVWYTTELPFQSGPWKLNGLPGLIIDAHDDKNQVKFEFAGMEMIQDDPIKVAEKNDKIERDAQLPEGFFDIKDISSEEKEIKLPGKSIKTNRKDFDKLTEAFMKDRMGFINTQMAGSDKTIKIENSNSRKPIAPVKKILNNPIELPEK
ncbi:MAG: GLPGLI family protein [Ginsengibacter sp.]